MEIRLTNAEVALVASHLQESPSLIIGERATDEMESLVEEGWRSLVARGLVRSEHDGVSVSMSLTGIVKDAITPRGIITYSRMDSDQALMSTLLIGNERVLSAVPCASEVNLFSEVSLRDVAASITADIEASNDSTGAFRLDTADMGTRTMEGLSWVVLPGPTIKVVDDSTTEVTLEELNQMITVFLDTAQADIPNGCGSR